MPLFSIITVCRNAAGTLAPTMQSVAQQTFDDYEHIVVDGASTDSTLDIVKEHATGRTSVTSEPDRGIYDAMNKGWWRASGEYLIYLNAGDRFHSPDTLREIAAAIAASEEREGEKPGVVFGDTVIVDKEGKLLGPRHLSAPETLTLDSFREGMTVCHQAFVAMKKLTGTFDLRYRYSADYDWCIKALQRSRVNVNCHRVLIDYLFEGATTRHRRRSLAERFRIMSYYYGFWPTLGRHFGFAVRRFKRRRLEKKFVK